MSDSLLSVGEIAALAAIEVTDNELAELSREISTILEYVAQLDDLGPDASSTPDPFGRERAVLRPDLVVTGTPIDLTQFAPALRDGYLTVPKVGVMEP